MQSAFATEFAFSRFNAFAAKGDHAAVGSSETTDIVDASSTERVADPATEEERRRLSEAPCPPPSPPPVPSPPKEDPTYQSLTCATGKKKDFYIVEAWPVNAAHDPATEEGPPQMCAGTGGYRLRDKELCKGEASRALGMTWQYEHCGGEQTPASHWAGMYPTEGCFYQQGYSFWSLCAQDGSDNGGNTYDAGVKNNLHRGVCYGCVDDP